MAVYARETRIDAPLDRVWRFHGRPEGLAALTPDWFGLRVESVVGPDGEPEPAELLEGSELRLSTRAFGFGPRQSWRSVIVERRREDDEAVFRDRMEEGPFPEWEHTHRFVAEHGATLVRDRVAYRLPGGPLSPLLSRLAVVGLGPTFRYRHRRAKQLLEEEGWTGWD